MFSAPPALGLNGLLAQALEQRTPPLSQSQRKREKRGRGGEKGGVSRFLYHSSFHHASVTGLVAPTPRKAESGVGEGKEEKREKEREDRKRKGKEQVHRLIDCTSSRPPNLIASWVREGANERSREGTTGERRKEGEREGEDEKKKEEGERLDLASQALCLPRELSSARRRRPHAPQAGETFEHREAEQARREKEKEEMLFSSSS